MRSALYPVTETENDRIKAALAFAREKHNGQKRKDGSDYINHPIRVANYLAETGLSEDYILAGLFHDLLEDTDASEEDILRLSSKAVLDAVKLVTKEKGFSKDKYIERIVANPIARKVKEADRIDNLHDVAKLHYEKNESFIKHYLAETKAYYFGRFSDELDRLFLEINKKV